MSFIKQHNLDKNVLSSILGAMVKGQKYKGKLYSANQMQLIAQEGYSLGWIDNEWWISKGGNSLTENVKLEHKETKTGLDDEQLASLYLYKVSNCRERRIPWELSLSELRKLVNKSRCHYTGEKLVREENHRNRPTLDRIDNSKGYTKENTVVCCSWVNSLKNELFEKPDGHYRCELKSLLKFLSKMS